MAKLGEVVESTPDPLRENERFNSLVARADERRQKIADRLGDRIERIGQPAAV